MSMNLQAMRRELEQLKAAAETEKAARQASEEAHRHEKLLNALREHGVPADRVRHAAAALGPATLDEQGRLCVTVERWAIPTQLPIADALEVLADTDEGRAWRDLFLQPEGSRSAPPPPELSAGAAELADGLAAAARRHFERPPTTEEKRRSDKLWSDIRQKLSGRSLADLLEGATVETDDN